MRTLLNEVLPPHCSCEPALSAREPEMPAQRTFLQNPVLTRLDDLVEVGLGGTVMATPGAVAEKANLAPGRGMAFESRGVSGPSLTQFQEAAAVV